MPKAASKSKKGTTVNIVIGGGAPAGLAGVPMPPRAPMGGPALPPRPPPGAVPPGVKPPMKRGGRIMAGSGSGLGRLRKNGCR